MSEELWLWRTIPIIFLLGAVAGVANYLNSSGNKFSLRLLLGSMLTGGITALSSGILIVLVFPDYREDALFIAAMAALAVHMGMHNIKHILFALINKKLGPDSKLKLDELLEQPTDTTDLKRLADSGQFTVAEIQAMIEEHKRLKKEKENLTQNMSNRDNIETPPIDKGE